MRRLAMVFFMVFTAYHAIGQEPEEDSGRKGQLSVYWGYNRAYYNRSDVHFRGPGFDFTLHGMRAEDMPEKFDPDVYFNIYQLSVPQFNFRVGYFIGPRTAISAGWDHMKYHLIPTQQATISGFIDPERYHLEDYSGDFDHEQILYRPAFMDFHHSDGLNYIRVSLERTHEIWASRRASHVLAFYGGVSVGAMMPWTDFTFFGTRFRNRPHFAGWAASLNGGFRYEFLQWFFVQVNAQAGRMFLGDIMLENELDARARQQIAFFERSWAVGGYIPLGAGRGRGGP